MCTCFVVCTSRFSCCGTSNIVFFGSNIFISYALTVYHPRCEQLMTELTSVIILPAGDVHQSNFMLSSPRFPGPIRTSYRKKNWCHDTPKQDLTGATSNHPTGKTSMNQHVFPIKNGDFPASHASFRECKNPLPIAGNTPWPYLFPNLQGTGPLGCVAVASLLLFSGPRS